MQSKRRIEDLWTDISTVLNNATIDGSQVINRIIDIVIRPSEITGWRKYEHYDDCKYARNLIHPGFVKTLNVYEGEDSDTGTTTTATTTIQDLPFQLVLMTWSPGQQSSIHDHAGSECCMRILQGTLTEERFEVDEGDIRLIQTQQLKSDEWTSIRDSIGWHRVSNLSGEAACSLHVYYPPIGQYRIVCPQSGGLIAVRCCHFHSINGILQIEESVSDN